MNKYFLSDRFSKVFYKCIDYLLKIKWLITIGHLGRGSYIRSGVKVIGNPKRIYIGQKFKVYQKTVIAIGRGEIKIGSNGLIGVGTYINCGNETLTIGDNVAIGPYCKIFTSSHHYSQDTPTNESYRNGNVTIEDNVLIGTNSVILPGVKIGMGAVIGACSFVNKDVEPNTIVSGVPAKFIKLR